MKNKTCTKIFITMLSIMMMLVMISCGNDTGDTEGNVLKLGGIGPITGPAALYGQAVNNGAQLAIDEINAKNNGNFQIEWQFEDDEHDAEKSVNAYNKLLDDNVQLIIGSVTSTPCAAVAAEAYNNRTFMLTPSASAPAVVENNDNVFQVCFSDPNQGTASAEYILKNFEDANVGVIYNNADNYSTGIYDKFKATYEASGKKLVAEEAFSSDDNADFTAQLDSLKSAGADFIFLPIYYTPASNILTQASKMGYAPSFLGCDGMDGILNLEGFDTSLAEGLMLLTPFTPYSKDEATQNFVKTYKEKYGELPIQFAADAYDSVYAIYYAFMESGVGTDASMEDICEAMIEVFSDPNFKIGGLTASEMTWNVNGEVSKTPKVCIIEDGKYIEK